MRDPYKEQTAFERAVIKTLGWIIALAMIAVPIVLLVLFIKWVAGL